MLRYLATAESMFGVLLRLSTGLQTLSCNASSGEASKKCSRMCVMQRLMRKQGFMDICCQMQCCARTTLLPATRLCNACCCISASCCTFLGDSVSCFLTGWHAVNALLLGTANLPPVTVASRFYFVISLEIIPFQRKDKWLLQFTRGSLSLARSGVLRQYCFCAMNKVRNGVMPSTGSALTI